MAKEKISKKKTSTTDKKKTAKKKVSKKKASKKQAVKKKTVKKKNASKKTDTATSRPKVSPTEREEMIAVAAYYRWEQSGFIAELEMEHWLQAEKDIDALIK